MKTIHEYLETAFYALLLSFLIMFVGFSYGQYAMIQMVS